MKKILLLFVLGAVISCDIGSDDGPNFTSELMSIQSVDIPDEFTFGETYEITVSYTRPNECYSFNDFFFQPNGNVRTVAVVDNVALNEPCTDNITFASESFDFRVTSMETYEFRFYRGMLVNGDDDYIVIEVPVVE